MMRQIIRIIIFIVLVAGSPVLLLAGGGNDAPSNVPLPTGLSKDTQFIIYYIDKRISALDKRITDLQHSIDKRFETFQKAVDERFEQVDKRFEQIDKRFEQVNQQFEQVNQRFLEVNQRFEQMMSFLWMLTGIFTTLTAAVIGFAYWDRRTIIRQARNEAIERIEREGRLQDFIRALRAYARKNKEFAEILKSFNLL